MKITIITSSPNKDGLTAACGRAAAAGAAEGGAEAVCIHLNALDIGRCHACGNGWGSCFNEHVCSGVEDDFQSLHKQMADSDAYVIITPVYWGEMSESAKAFTDRLRRCEAYKELIQGKTLMHGKPVAGVAAAGGSGNGTVSCLESMERFFKHMGTNIFDLITITRKSRPYKLEAIKACVKEMAVNGMKEYFSPQTYTQKPSGSGK